MSWAAPAATGASPALDATPLAATVRAARVKSASSSFFPGGHNSSSSPNPAGASEQQREEEMEFAAAVAARGGEMGREFVQRNAEAALALANQANGTTSHRASGGSVAATPVRAKPSASSLSAALAGSGSSSLVASEASASPASPFVGTALHSNIGLHASQSQKSSANASASASGATRGSATSSTSSFGSPLPPQQQQQQQSQSHSASQATMASSGAVAGGLSLHAQQALQDEVSALRRELARQEKRLAQKDAAVSAQAAALQALQAEKVAAQSRSRAQINEVRKAVVEGETRLEHVRAELAAQKEREVALVQRQGAQAVEAQQALLDSVAATIRASASAHVLSSPSASPSPSSASLSSPGEQLPSSTTATHAALAAVPSPTGFAPGLSMAGAGLTHEETLKAMLDQFKKERREWDVSRAREVAGLRAEYESRVSQANQRYKAVKAQYAQAFQEWREQHDAQSGEIGALASLLAQLTFLLEEVDRGVFPVGEKHGVRAWAIPSHKRRFLAADSTQHSLLVSGELQSRLTRLKLAFTRANIPWDPEDLARDQSFLRDDVQAQARAMRIQAGTEGQKLLGAGEGQQQLLLQSGDNGDEEEEEEAKEQHPHPQALGAERAQLEESLLADLSSHATVTYIAGLEAEREHYKRLLALETKKRLELKASLSSQTRVRPDVHAHAHADAEQELQMNHSTATAGARSKARDIVSASRSMALHSAAARQGLQVGVVSNGSVAQQGMQGVTEGSDLGSGGFFPLASASALHTSPARAVLTADAPSVHLRGASGGAYTNANIAVYDAVPKAAIIKGGVGQVPSSARPASAKSSSRSTTTGSGNTTARHQHSYSTVSAFSVSSGSSAMNDSRPVSAYVASHQQPYYQSPPSQPRHHHAAGSQLNTSRSTATPSRPQSAVSTHSHGGGGGGGASSSRRSTSSSHAAAMAAVMAAQQVAQQQVVPAPPAAVAAAFPRPAPMHLTHGNNSATLLTAVTAKKAHQDNLIAAGIGGGVGGGGASASPTLSSRAPGNASPLMGPHSGPSSRMHSRQPSAAVEDLLAAAGGLSALYGSPTSSSSSPLVGGAMGSAAAAAGRRGGSAARARVIAQ